MMEILWELAEKYGLAFCDAPRFHAPMTARCELLKGIDTDFDSEKVLFYYTMGEERWKKTKVWPVVGTKTMRLYMSGDNSLSESAPTLTAAADSYKVDYEASTGEKTVGAHNWAGRLFIPTAQKRIIACSHTQASP